MNPGDLEKRLMAAFRSEAAERIDSLFSRLTEIENCRDEDRKTAILEVVFREAHSLKGAARSVNIGPIEALCQKMESIFGALKSAELDFTPTLFDTLHDATRAIETYLEAGEAAKNQTEDQMTDLGRLLESILKKQPTPTEKHDKTVPDAHPDLPGRPAQSDATALLSQQSPDIDEADSGPLSPIEGADNSSVQYRPLFSDSVRISTTKLDALLLKAEELITVKQIAGQHLTNLKGIRDILDCRKQWEKLLAEFAAFTDKNEKPSGDKQLKERLDGIFQKQQDGYEKIVTLIQTMEQGNRVLSTMINDILDETREVTLHPFTALFDVLPRMVREIARDRGKSAELFLSGGEIEIDKRILEGIKDPILHLLRNAVDHGIESPEIRMSRGKPEKGIIRIDISQIESNRVELSISDDGDGIDLSAVRAKALKSGVVSEKEMDQFTDADIVSFIFHSGLSTSALISEISGRGLGMAIVKDGIEQLGGSITVTTESGQGSTFLLRLPVTQATFRGILVRCAGHLFILPNANVLHALQLSPESVKTVENRQVVRLNRQAVSLVYLHQVLGLPKPPSRAKKESPARPNASTAVIVEKDDNRIAFVVDAVLNEQEVLVKNLGKQLGRVNHIAGATVLGSGQVVPVLNVNDLIRSASGRILSTATAAASTGSEEKGKKSILIVEDSFTSRTLLKNILEASGYMVETAIDGEEGFSHLKTAGFDAVVSDIEMPRMDGIELTRKIRGDGALAETPVILVSSLDSREDRERGIDAGANAYIVKSSFDQGNLLAALEKLI